MQVRSRSIISRDRSRLHQPFSSLLRQAASSLLPCPPEHGDGINHTSFADAFSTHQQTPRPWTSVTAIASASLFSQPRATPPDHASALYACHVQGGPTPAAIPAVVCDAAYSPADFCGAQGPYSYSCNAPPGSRAARACAPARPGREPAPAAGGAWGQVDGGAAARWAADDPFHADWPHW